jgi:hypothetical protein
MIFPIKKFQKKPSEKIRQDGLKRRRAYQLFIRKGVELCPISKNH